MMTRPFSRAMWLAVALATAAVLFVPPYALRAGSDQDDEQRPAGRIAAILSCVIPARGVEGRSVPSTASAESAGTGGCEAFPGSHPMGNWMTEC